MSLVGAKVSMAMDRGDIRGHCRLLSRYVKSQINRLLTGKSGPNAIRDPYEDLSHLSNTKNPVIVDGGANVGQTIESLTHTFDSPTIVSFEANKTLCDKLEHRYSNASNIVVEHACLGPESKTVEFNINHNPATSSVLESSEVNFDRHGDDVLTKETEDVKQIRLDDYFETAPDIIKLDLQGYEIEALRGAAGILPETHIVLTEVAFLPLYESQPLFHELDSWMRKRGFRLFNFYELWTSVEGQVVTGDAIYVNEDYY